MTITKLRIRQHGLHSVSIQSFHEEWYSIRYRRTISFYQPNDAHTSSSSRSWAACTARGMSDRGAR